MRFLFFDTETYCVKETDKYLEQEFRLASSQYMHSYDDGVCVIETPEEHFKMNDIGEKILTLTRTSKPLHVLSNNIWFDIRVIKLLPFLELNGYKVQYFHVSGTCVIFKLSNGKKDILLLNLYQFIPASVEKMGQVLGYPKSTIDFKTTNDAELMKYCVIDTQIITKIFSKWIEFISKHQIGKMGLTLASQSLIAYKTRFMSHDIFIHGNKKLTEFERLGYYGGRTECFYIGTVPHSNVYCVDVNSMYPFIMCEYKIPNKFIGTNNDISLRELRKLQKRYYCIAQVAVNTTKNYYPLKHEGKLLFPIGKFITVLSGSELEMAVDNEDIEHIYNVSYYKSDYIFRDFVKYFYNIRKKYKKQNNEVFSYLTKILLNSLYGKFGQRMDEVYIETDEAESDYQSYSMYDTDTNKRWKCTQIGTKKKIYIENINDSYDAFPIICASITSYARTLLLKYMEIVGEENYFYCDTDSLFVNADGLENLKKYINETKLGYLSIDKVAKNVQLHGAKDYVWDGQETIKGISKLAKKVIGGVYDTIQFPGAKSELRNGMTDNYRIKKVRKVLKREYTKAINEKEGFTSPIIMEEY